MTFFNKIIDKARNTSQLGNNSSSNSTPSVEQPSTPAPTPTKESPNSLHNTFTSLLNQNNKQQTSSSSHGLATPPANAHPEMTRSTSSDEATRMSLDNPDGAASSQHDSLQPQRQHELMNISSSESLRGKKRKRRERPVSLPSNVAKQKKDDATRPHLTTQSVYDNQDAKSTTSNQSQQKERHVRSVPSYTAVYNDNAIIQQRQNRPRLKLADFHILRTLGTGSFGRVHLVQSRVNARYYAIKVLKKSEVVRLKQVAHSNNEKHILETVAHPFLVNMWGTFQDDIYLYMVMDYVPGGELFSVLRRSQRFPDHVAKFYAAEVVLAIEYLHSKDVIYRDLKPENLLLDAQGHIRITDFGFAKYVPDITWTLCGTPDYLAPEIIQSKGYGKAADWWSLGILIFEMLAGYPPFYDDDHLKLYEKILQGRIRWPQYFDPHAKDLLKRLLTSDLSKRYGNLKNGADDIKNHRWFEGVDFNRLLARQIRAPYIPQIRGDGDASHFDRYPETQEQYGVTGTTDPYHHLFPDF
ncbi:camp-dependent protein kinase 5 [Fennellomyces sp. T-0311]|nr:camp-dependent protein kinase 5 [Fennellomyces sp. T-0311]